ncbi:Crp/Fnr family transcriptional regulator [Listeria monocytogenes]|nr:Crp/Fnr family transcriptional regulator [Listeria monocytogenes]EAC4365849.1 Crp/Fnr family transcriptional regulator [Listeria monocytogenes]EAC4831139.1 Crp/Fnr family transcriptional regulator [Listeria monocytogenes]EAC9834115.1 Crp/Fnr family transcriptional regulator [Listeria monocytogenes]EAD0432132.1 Crp/Fnr family transcriptional regulator [Listeria monocytogenes]
MIERLSDMTMTFLELHRFMKEDALLYSRIQKMFPLRWQHLEKGKSRLMHSGQVILVQRGLLVEVKQGKKLRSYCRMFADKQLIFSTKGVMALRALEDTKYSVLPTDILFDQLEEQKLLSNLILQQQEDLEKERDLELELQWCNVGEKVELLLQSLIQKYQLNPRTNPAFPSWLNIQTLARFGNSSATMTSKRVSELADKGVIDTKTTPWRLLQPLPKAVQ